MCITPIHILYIICYVGAVAGTFDTYIYAGNSFCAPPLQCEHATMKRHIHIHMFCLALLLV